MHVKQSKLIVSCPLHEDSLSHQSFKEFRVGIKTHYFDVDVAKNLNYWWVAVYERIG